MAYLCSLDVGNRALQHVGGTLIADVNEDSKNNKETSFAYDKVRRAELRRNTWRFAIRRAALRAIDEDTMVLVPDDYSSTTTYLAGAIVKDQNGEFWLSMVPNNLNNTPGDTDVWEHYFGPVSLDLYDNTTGYFAGELVYKPGFLAGSYVIYQSQVSNNKTEPSAATPYDVTKTYHSDDIVSYLGSQWKSRIEINLGIVPADGPLAFDSGATYTIGQTVTGSDNFIYSSVGNGNIGHDPVTDAGIHWTNTGVAHAWTRTPAVPVSAGTWRVISATMESLNFLYPIGSGPSWQSETRNVFRLPAGYLMVASQDPKAGSSSFLGAPSGLAYNDWMFEGNFLVTRDIGPTIFRFVADITKVRDMDDMFCEGLACRIATAICEPLTQSSEKLQTIASAYKLFMSEARTRNMIETGPEEPPEDDWITCRV